MSVVKVKGGYENIGKTGIKHGVLKTKAEAERQKAAIFAEDPKLARKRRPRKSKLRKAVEDAVNQHMGE